MIRKVLAGLFVMLASLNLVFAASSEIVADFTIGVSTGEVSKYINLKDVVGDYLGYAVLTFIVLAFVYFFFKKKGSARNSVPSRKGTKVPSSSGKKKKISKSKK